jgi:hypothetical protein
MGYKVSISDGAPISQALAMRFNGLEADIKAAEVGSDRIDVALNGMFNFMSALIQAVHQLETGEVPPVTRFTDATQNE